MRLGWQKFLGQEIRTEQPHRLTGPILMDATVEQHDGYRFVYVLPFAADRLLIEDTYYSERPGSGRRAVLRERIDDYAACEGVDPGRVIREEAGVLPITLAGDVDALLGRPSSGQCCAGLTGRAVPPDHRLFLARRGSAGGSRGRVCPHLDAGPLFATIRAYAAERWRTQAFFRALNRMLFLAGDPGLALGHDAALLPASRTARSRASTPALCRPGTRSGCSSAGRRFRSSGAVRALLDTAVAGLTGQTDAGSGSSDHARDVGASAGANQQVKVTGKTAAVIGAGFGGLALAIRLQTAGIATTLLEKRDKPGGRAYVYEDQGFTFDAGPTVITDPSASRSCSRCRAASSPTTSRCCP